MVLSLPVQHRLLSSLERNPGLWAALIIAFALVVRVVFVATGQLNLAQDEAQYWDWSRRLQLSYYSKGPLIAWVIAFWTGIFGNTELGVRMGALVNATLAQILLYWFLAHCFQRPRLGVLALMVANTMPLFLASGLLMTTDNILLVCWLAAFISLYLATRSSSPGWALPMLGLAMAAGNLAKYMMLAFFGVAILYLYLLYRHRLVTQAVIIRILVVMVLGSAVGFMPILIWNMANDWVGFRHVGTLAGVTGSKASRLIRLDTMPEFVGGQLGVATPWWFILMLFAGWRALRGAWQGYSIHEDPLREKPVAEQVRQSALLAAGFWPIILGMFIWSFHTRIYANWSGMAYVAGIILAASGLERLLAGYGSRRARKFAPLWPWMGAVVFVVLFAQALLPLPSHINPTARLKGWADMGQELQRLAGDLPNPHKVFYFSDNYDVTAELAFYAPNQPTAYCVDFGRRHSQYDFWPTPDDPASPGGDKTGWDAIYVTTRTAMTYEVERFENMFSEVHVFPYSSTHQGRKARQFYIGVLRNFNGQWPHIENEKY